MRPQADDQKEIRVGTARSFRVKHLATYYRAYSRDVTNAVFI